MKIMLIQSSQQTFPFRWQIVKLFDIYRYHTRYIAYTNTFVYMYMHTYLKLNSLYWWFRLVRMYHVIAV